MRLIFSILIIFLLDESRITAQVRHKSNQWGETILSMTMDDGISRNYVTQSGKHADSADFFSVSGKKMKLEFTERYYREKSNSDNSELYGLIRSGKPISDVVIDVLDLDNLIERAGKHLVMPYQLSFKECYIRRIKIPVGYGGDAFSDSTTVRLQDSTLLFLKPILFYSCTLPEMQFRNVVFQDRLSLINNLICDVVYNRWQFSDASFTSRVNVIEDYSGTVVGGNSSPVTLGPSDRKLIDSLGPDMLKSFYENSDNPSYDFSENCKFVRPIWISNNIPSFTMNFSNARFDDTVLLSRFVFWKKDTLRLVGIHNDYSVSSYSYPLCNVNFGSSKIAGNFYLHNENLLNVNFNDTEFSDSLFLFNTYFVDTVANKSGFQHAHFKKGTVAMLNPARFNLANLNISSASIDDLKFPYWNTNTSVKTDSIAYLDNSNSFYDKLITDTKLAYSKQEALSADLVNKFSHNKLEYKMSYLKKNPGFINTTQFAGYNFLERTVGNGYNGALSFFYSCSLVIVLFSILYFIFFQQEMTDFTEVSVSKEKSPQFKDPKVPPAPSPVVRYTKCLWQSFIFFISPKFSARYFGFSNRLFLVITIEWLIGILMIILFLVYIASTYPFIRALLGL